MVETAAVRMPVRLEQVDGNGLQPLRAADRDYSTAFAFRRFLQKELPGHLTVLPAADPLAKAARPRGSLDQKILRRYDRPWGPERPIFGTVRYMSSTNTARKVRVKDFIRRYAP
jgi:hypothetical protein